MRPLYHLAETLIKNDNSRTITGCSTEPHGPVEPWVASSCACWSGSLCRRMPPSWWASTRQLNAVVGPSRESRYFV